MWIKEYIKDQLRYQMMDLSSVKIQHRYNEKVNKFFLDSRAGLIVYRPKNKQDIARFRDRWVNRIEGLKIMEGNGEDVSYDLFKLYEEILDSEKVSYEANLNTRVKKLWNSIKFISRIS